MTREEISKWLSEHQVRTNKNATDLEAFARGLVHLLKDHHADSSAKELERLLFAIDVEKEEFGKLMLQDPIGVLNFIKTMMEPPR